MGRLARRLDTSLEAKRTGANTSRVGCDFSLVFVSKSKLMEAAARVHPLCSQHATLSVASQSDFDLCDVCPHQHQRESSMGVERHNQRVHELFKGRKPGDLQFAKKTASSRDKQPGHEHKHVSARNKTKHQNSPSPSFSLPLSPSLLLLLQHKRACTHTPTHPTNTQPPDCSISGPKSCMAYTGANMEQRKGHCGTYDFI